MKFLWLVLAATATQFVGEISRNQSGYCGANQIMNEINPTLMDILRILCSGLLGGIIGAFVNDFLARRRDNRERKLHFVGRMSGLKSSAEISEDFSTWFAKSKPIVEQECALIERAISKKLRARFITARNRYADAQRKDIEDAHNSISGIEKYQMGRIFADGLLKELIACASI